MTPAPSATSSPRSVTVDRVRRGGLALVMVGALSVSVRGQVQAVEPLLGDMSVVLALTNDLAALLALNELMSTQRRAVRRWAWAVLVLAGGTAAGLNTWHALQAGALPPLWAVVVGIGPVLLAVVLSHLIALVLSDAAEQRGTAEDGRVDVAATVHPTVPAAPAATADAERPPHAVLPAPRVESSRAAQEPVAALSGPGVHPVHHGLAVVPTPRDLTAAAPQDGGGGSSPPGRPADSSDRRVERLVAQLRAGAELTGATAAEQLGCSPRTGRRLLRQAEEHLATTTSATSTAAAMSGGTAVEAGRPARERGTG